MANKNFVVKNGIEVATDLIYAENGRVGVGTTIPSADFNVDGNSIFSGIVTAATYYGDGSKLSGLGNTANVITSSLTVIGLTTARDEEIYTQFNIVNQGNTAFRYQSTGIGFTEPTDNPDIFISRGKNYRFVLDSNTNPFYIKTAPIVGAASSFNHGVVGNGSTVGIVTFKVPFDAPNTLYYQASTQLSMGGHIYVLDAGIGTDVNLNTSGVITATSFYGDGSNLSGIATQLTATIGLSSGGTIVGSGVTLIDFVQGDGQPRLEVTSVDVTTGIGTVVVAPGISVGLAIALGS